MEGYEEKDLTSESQEPIEETMNGETHQEDGKQEDEPIMSNDSATDEPIDLDEYLAAVGSNDRKPHISMKALAYTYSGLDF